MSAEHPEILDVRMDYPGVMAIDLRNPGDVDLDSFATHVKNLTTGADHFDWTDREVLVAGEYRTVHVNTADLVPLAAEPGTLNSQYLEITLGGRVEDVEYNASRTVVVTVDEAGAVEVN